MKASQSHQWMKIFIQQHHLPVGQRTAISKQDNFHILNHKHEKSFLLKWQQCLLIYGFFVYFLAALSEMSVCLVFCCCLTEDINAHILPTYRLLELNCLCCLKVRKKKATFLLVFVYKDS